MNDEQNIQDKPTETGEDTSKVAFGDSTLQSKEEFENDKDNNYYDVDKPNKELITTIGDGEMRNEGTGGMGDIPEDNLLNLPGQTDEQDNAELRDSES